MHMQQLTQQNQYGWTPPDSDKYFCSQGCKTHEWLNKLIWKILNMVDQLSLSDTDERAKVMKKVTETHDSGWWNL